VEILIVVTIIGVLVAMVIPRLSGRSKQAKITVAKADIEANLSIALDLYELDCGAFPGSEDGLAALIIKPDSSPFWKGPYLKSKKTPKDPWGNEYVYTCPGANNSHSYDLFSYGPDGTEGGDDDITNWESDVE